MTISSWVKKSTSARTMFRPADSLMPTTLMIDSTTMTPAPNNTSPGADRSGSQNSPPM